MDEMITVNDALNEYYKLKRKFEDELDANKKKIINNQNLSKIEKRAEFLKLKPKCINCKRPSKAGTLFSIEYIKESDKTGAYRRLKSSCGDLANPCPLNIEIHLGEMELLDDLMDKIQEEIRSYKNKIIVDKNKLLFGLITTETALENFDFNKSYITELTTIYESYLDLWNSIVDNRDKKAELDEALVQSYNSITQIKEAIKKMQENDSPTFAADAASIYVNNLKPLLEKIRHLKYSENMVYRDEANNCRLIQKKYTYADIGVSGYESKVAHFNVGLDEGVAKKKAATVKPTPRLIIEPSSSSSSSSASSSASSSSTYENKGPAKEFTIKINELA
jgi:hypothetical protein